MKNMIKQVASGPLTGIKVIEFAGIGPGPFAAMLLSDMGAEVLRIDRKGAAGSGLMVTERGRRSVAMDLKNPASVEACLKLIETADILIEGFRPGVMERLGLGPEVALKRKPSLIYGRMTGWGQTGPLAKVAGHDLNYIALSGALAAIGPAGGKPTPPLNLVGDFGGGSLYLALGIVAALYHAGKTGEGQVVDAAITDGAISLMSFFFGLRASGEFKIKRGENWLDGGAHFYDTYECADGKFISIAPLEPKFYALLRARLGLADPEFDAQMDREKWPELKVKIAAVIKTRTRDEWCGLLEGTDACVAPVLTLDEVANHPHNRARRNTVDVGGVLQPAPAPRFSRTPGAIQGPPPKIGEHTEVALIDWGLTADEVRRLGGEGAI
jgi:alpha-methylacyl-CoA racemase